MLMTMSQWARFSSFQGGPDAQRGEDANPVGPTDIGGDLAFR